MGWEPGRMGGRGVGWEGQGSQESKEREEAKELKGRSWESKVWEARSQDPPCPKDLIQNTGVHRGVLDEYFTALFNNARTLKFKRQPTFAQFQSQNTEVYFNVFRSLWFLAFDQQISIHFFVFLCVKVSSQSSPRLALLAKCRVHLAWFIKQGHPTRIQFQTT